MKSETAPSLQYPIGKFVAPASISNLQVEKWIHTLESFPDKLKNLVIKLNNKQLDTPYRNGGWTVRQVIHHLADSHMNSYIRFKWALTENQPMIKAYFEDKWADLTDAQASINISLNLLTALHAKWVYMLKNLSEKELESVFIHPDGNKAVSLRENLGIYAWHCDHHYAHIKNLMDSKKW